MELDAALEERIWADPSALSGALARPRPRTLSGGQPQAGAGAAGRDGARAGRDGARPRRAGRGRGPTCSCCPGRRASCSRCGRRRSATDAVRDAVARARRSCEQRIMRIFGIPESRARRGSGAEVARPRRAGDHHLPAAGRDRDRDGLRACRRRRTTRRSRRRSSTASARGVLARRVHDRRRSSRAAARAAGPHGGGGRVVHGRADDGPAHGARRAPRPTCSAGVIAYSNEAKIAQVGVPAALIERHGAVSPEVARALAAGARAALRRRPRDRHHGHRGPGRRDGGEAGRDRLRLRVVRRRAG